jgi:hypothetical protein
MVWVRSEYAGELAVLAAWVAALLPWNIMYAPESRLEGLGGSVLYIRWPFVQVRYVFDVPIADATRVDLPTGALDIVTGSVTLAYEIWIAGAVVVALATLLSVSMYVVDGLDERAVPADRLKTLGTLLTAGSVGVAGSAIVLDVQALLVWLGGALLLAAVGLVWLDQTIERPGLDGPARPDEAVPPDEEPDDEDDTEPVGATDGGESTATHDTSLPTGTAVLVGLVTVALSGCGVFVAVTMMAVSWPAGWIALLGVSVPTVVNQALVVGTVATLLGAILYLTAELLERDQPVLTVRLMGGLLGLASVVLVGATVVFAQRGVFNGIPIPLGMLVLVPLAWILLTVDLT